MLLSYHQIGYARHKKHSFKGLGRLPCSHIQTKFTRKYACKWQIASDSNPAAPREAERAESRPAGRIITFQRVGHGAGAKEGQPLQTDRTQRNRGDASKLGEGADLCVVDAAEAVCCIIPCQDPHTQPRTSTMPHFKSPTEKKRRKPLRGKSGRANKRHRKR